MIAADLQRPLSPLTAKRRARPRRRHRRSATPRAQKYRPFLKVEGRDADFIALDLTSETEHPRQRLRAMNV